MMKNISDSFNTDHAAASALAEINWRLLTSEYFITLVVCDVSTDTFQIKNTVHQAVG